MRIWEHTLSELVGDVVPDDGGPDGPNVPQPFILASVVPITQIPGFATALIQGGSSFANQALLEWTEGEWQCVGSYVDDTILIDQRVRGKGLAEELVLRCAEHRNALPVTTALTGSGYGLLKRVHRLAVQRAIEANLAVPQKVLEEHND